MIEYRGTVKQVIYPQAAALPFRYIDEGLEILLITSRKGKRWIIPKGLLEEGLSPVELAAKEAWEEAGISGNISMQSLGEYEYEKWNGVCRVNVFSLCVLNVLDTWPEDSFRFRKWFPADEAVGLVEHDGLKRILVHFIQKHHKITV
jgi:8-oxo-dGTP pyrophosphatase MutT (NUDIX family)